MADENQERLRELKYCFDRWRIEHFDRHELCRLAHEDWDGMDVVAPPGDLLHNIKYTVSLADKIRREWGGPVQVNSGYRPPLYNDLIGGADDSAHTYFRAMDLCPVDGNIAKFHDHVQPIVESYKNSSAHDKATGSGLYDWGLHLDVGITYDGYDKHRRWDNRKLTKADE